MGKSRIEAFSDGVLAITIMVLELKALHGDDMAALHLLIPVFLSYLLSFIYIGIYWSNHHHLFHAIQRLSGARGPLGKSAPAVLVITYSLRYRMGENHFAPAPTALYSIPLLMVAIVYWLLQRVIMAMQGHGVVASRRSRQRPLKVCRCCPDVACSRSVH